MTQCTFEIQKVCYEAPKDIPGLAKFNSIKETVCKYFNIEESKVRGLTRAHPILHARQLIMAFTYANCKHLTTKYIGHYFGDRDHTTVIYSVGAVIDKLKVDPTDILTIGHNEIKKLLPFESKQIKFRKQPVNQNLN